VPAPVPPQAAQQYAAALKLMKNGQVTDAELEFKHMAAVYPEFAGPQLNLGLLYLQASRPAGRGTPVRECTPCSCLQRSNPHEPRWLGGARSGLLRSSPERSWR